MAIAKGTQVRQIVPVITGTVVGFNIDQESGKRLFLVEWTNDEGETQQKYFAEDEVEVA